MNYNIMLSPVARKQLGSLGEKQRTRISSALRELASDPFTNRPGVDVKKLIGLKNAADLYRLRVGQYRIIFDISQDAIWVSEIVKRSSAYKFLL